MRKGPKPIAMRTRFRRYIHKTKTYWLWTGGKAGRGYGVFYVGDGRRLDYAHRVSWQLHRGPVPDGKGVLHRCDVPACVRPSHLFIGNGSDNMKDAFSKGRGKIPKHVGGAHPNAKLTEAKVRRIRREYRPGNGVLLAKKYGVNKQCINAVVNKLTWRHV